MNFSRSVDFGRITAITAIVCFIVLTATTWVSLIFPSSTEAVFLASALPVTEPHEAAADQALSRRVFDRAYRSTIRALNLSPTDNAAWLRLAQIDDAEHHRLTPSGMQALSHAYDAVPYDLDPASARMIFVLARFGDLSPSLQQSVADELNAWAVNPGLRAKLATFIAGHGESAGSQAAKAALARTDVG